MSYRVHSSPLICKYLCLYCSFVGSGYRERDVYCIYEDNKKNKKKKLTNVKQKKSVIIKKAHVVLNVPTFLSKCILFGKALTTVALSCCDGKTTENMKHKVCLLVERGGWKSQNERVLALSEGHLCLSASPLRSLHLCSPIRMS